MLTSHFIIHPLMVMSGLFSSFGIVNNAVMNTSTQIIESLLFVFIYPELRIPGLNVILCLIF